MSEKIEENKTIKYILIAAAIVTVITFINKLLGQSETELAAKKSRQRGYANIEPSFEEYVYEDYATTLEAALAQDTTEDEQSVYSVFKEVKNISDINKLIDHYGKRRIAYHIGGYTLPEAIAKLFSASEKAQLNGILAKKGITYKFK